MSPEVNQILYVHCSDDGLVMGNEIYVYNQGLVGYEQDITKVIDVWATPIYEASMKPTGQFHLPMVIRPNHPLGEVWVERSAIKEQMVTLKNSMFQKKTSATVQGKTYEQVSIVLPEVWTRNTEHGIPLSPD